MDIQPQSTAQATTQPISDDQELAKALAGIAQEPEVPEVPDTPVAPVTPLQPLAAAPMQFEETPVVPSETPVTPATDAMPTMPTITPLPQPSASPITDPSVTPTDDLTGIKNDALNELRPLIDRVDLPVEEKFDTYLMLIRSTDDTSLIAPAHAAAQAIVDEKRKAQALLDIIKEIDFLSHANDPIA